MVARSDSGPSAEPPLSAAILGLFLADSGGRNETTFLPSTLEAA